MRLIVLLLFLALILGGGTFWFIGKRPTPQAPGERSIAEAHPNSADTTVSAELDTDSGSERARSAPLDTHQPTEPPVPGGAGRVLVEVKLRESGQPASDVVMELEWSCDAMGNAWETGRTDVEGRWRLDMPAGRMIKRLRLAGSAEAGPAIRELHHRLGAGEIHRVEVALPPPLELRGVVLGPDRMPRPHARVRVWWRHRGNKAHRFEEWEPDCLVRADALGEFHVPGVRLGTFLAAESGPQEIALAMSLDRKQVAAPRNGAAVIDQLVLPLLRERSLLLRVEDETGDLVQAPELQVWQGRIPSPESFGNPSDTVNLTAPGVVSRAALAEEGQVFSGGYGLEWEAFVRHSQYRDWRGAIPAKVEKFVVTVVSGLRLTGRVVDVDGKPVPEATVTLRGRKNFRSTVSDQDGRFVLAGLQADERPSLVAVAKGFAEARARSMTIPHEGGAIEITLERSLAIAGTVVFEDDTPAPMVAIRTRGETTQTDQEGRFRIEGLAPGFHRVGVYPPARPELRASGVPIEAGDEDARIVLREGNGWVGIEGQVVDGRTGLPVQRFEISPRGENKRGRIREFMHPDGLFVLDALQAGEWALDVRAEGYARFETPGIAITKGKVFEVVEIYPERSLHCQVVDLTGSPVPGASVRVLESDGRERLIRKEEERNSFTWSASANELGQIGLHGLPACKIIIDVHAPYLVDPISYPLDLSHAGAGTQLLTIPVDVTSARRDVLVALLEWDGTTPVPKTFDGSLPDGTRWLATDCSLVAMDSSDSVVAQVRMRIRGSLTRWSPNRKRARNSSESAGYIAVPPGPIRLEALAEGFRPAVLELSESFVGEDGETAVIYLVRD